jgi:YVTN family beta-propeller protein
MQMNRSMLAIAGALGALAFASQAQAAKVEKQAKVGPGLYELVFNPGDGDVYVASTGNRGAGVPAKIVRVDGKTLAIEGEIDVQANPVFGLGINTKTQTLYGADTRGGVVTAIDLKTSKIVASIKTGQPAHLREVIVDEAANKIYVSMVGGGEGRGGGPRPPSEIWVIDGSKNTLERVVAVPEVQLLGIALDTAGKRIFGTDLRGNRIVVVDLATDKIVQTWPAGAERPTNLVYDAAGARLFVSNQSGALTVLDSRSGALIKAVPTGAGALGVAYDPANARVYVTNRGAGTTTVVDAKTYAVIANPQTGALPQSVVVDRATSRVFVTNKSRGAPRGSAPGTPVPEDPGGDTIALLAP